ncbi:MAG: hypothetical protein Q8P22_02610 [Chloroflexota bacterium]|nr:hypothetical protein [Chloroflexota bacterium]
MGAAESGVASDDAVDNDLDDTVNDGCSSASADNDPFDMNMSEYTNVLDKNLHGTTDHGYNCFTSLDDTGCGAGLPTNHYWRRGDLNADKTVNILDISQFVAAGQYVLNDWCPYDGAP